MARYTKKGSKKTKKSSKKRNYVKPGFTRQVGYYGRYNGTPGWEKKFFDTDIPATAIGGNGINFGSMNLVPQNTQANGRIGRKIVLTNLQFNFYANKAVDSPFTVFRITVVLDRQSNGANAGFGDVWQTAPDLTAYPNMQNTQRFAILYDKFIELTSGTVSTTVSVGGTTNTTVYPIVSKHFKWNKRVNIPIEFSDGSPTTIANVKSNNILVFAQAAGAGQHTSNIDGQFRVRYSDS